MIKFILRLYEAWWRQSLAQSVASGFCLRTYDGSVLCREVYLKGAMNYQELVEFGELTNTSIDCLKYYLDDFVEKDVLIVHENYVRIQLSPTMRGLILEYDAQAFSH